MSAPVVVDASLIAAFLLREPEGQKFDSLLSDVSHRRVELHVPVIFVYEMLNILMMAERRKRITYGQHESILAMLGSIPFVLDAHLNDPVRSRINEFARTYTLSSYDAAYVELGERLGGRLVSLDKDILKLKKKLKWIS